ncbi:MAG: hypothetical protein KZQ63_03440 [Candidatus Thiodiazotropha sp. (ex Lucinoma aequizonata)]|nr:hypothetical protein [Candidatus Thiodiazotropha sp. (ex Lucinoma aequizonata)]
MRSLYALHLSLSVTIPAIQPRLRLSGTNRLRSAFYGGQRQRMLEIYALRWGIEVYFKRGETASWFSPGANDYFCIAYGIGTPVRDSLLDASAQ